MPRAIERAPAAPRLDWRQLPLHSILLAAYPALFLYAQNAADQVQIDPLLGPLAASVAGALALLGALTLLLRDPLRAGLLTTIAAALFFSYGHVWTLIGPSLGSQWWLVAAWAALALIGLVAVWRWGGGRPGMRVSGALTVLSAIAVGINVALIGAHLLGGVAIGSSRLPGPSGAVDLEQAPDARPDIYYIVPDRYAGLEALAQTYGYDNAPFYEALEERGFYTARQSYANYVKTPFSLVSTLNMEYLDAEQLQEEARSGEDRAPIHRRLQGHLTVPVLLKELGYEYVQVANWWEPSRRNVDADRVYRYEGESEFSSVFWRTTLLRAFVPETEALHQWDWRVLRQHSETELEALEGPIPDLGGPKFVFAHILLPHDPYVFDTDGSFMNEAQVAEQGLMESYLRQLQYLNGRLLGIVDGILAASPDEPPIIVLQADEGPFPERYRRDEWGFAWTDATEAELEVKFGILNAIHLPGADPTEAGLHPQITPVNTFRVIFNTYFGGELPLLPDRVYAHTDLWHFFDMFEVTERLTDQVTEASG
jgi:hypothetical protein